MRKNNRIMKINEAKATGGFTLVEMIVAIAVFSIVAVVISSVLIFMSEAGRQARGINSLMNNLSFAVESMGKNIRVGTRYHCGDLSSIETPQNCPSGSAIMAFETNFGSSGDPSDQWVYRFNSSTGRIERSTDGGNTFMNLTSSSIKIKNMKFYTTGTVRGDNFQPKVVIILQGYTKLEKGRRSSFNLQTSATQRVIDF